MKIKNVAKVIILNADNQVLILRRSQHDADDPGRLDYPGGGIKNGETPREAAAREVHEETGITVQQESLVPVYLSTVFSDSRQMSINRTLFAVKLSNPEIVLSPAHTEHSWLPIEHALREFPHKVYGAGLSYAYKYKLLPI